MEVSHSKAENSFKETEEIWKRYLDSKGLLEIRNQVIDKYDEKFLLLEKTLIIDKEREK